TSSSPSPATSWSPSAPAEGTSSSPSRGEPWEPSSRGLAAAVPGAPRGQGVSVTKSQRKEVGRAAERVTRAFTKAFQKNGELDAALADAEQAFDEYDALVLRALDTDEGGEAGGA